MTEPITAMGQLLDRYAELRGVVAEALDLISEEKGWGTYSRMEGSQLYHDADRFRDHATAALARDITTALDDAPQDQRQR